MSDNKFEWEKPQVTEIEISTHTEQLFPPEEPEQS